MSLGSFSRFTIVLLACCAAAVAGPVNLDTNSYNFQLNGGGGGASATINQTQNVEIFCVDYANDIYVPQQGYSANLSTITVGSDLSETRFGGVASNNWTQLNSFFIGNTDAGIVNGAGALARYQMAAYLVSQYNLPGGNNASNNGIQQAIWDILDPKSYNATYNTSTDNAIESAAQWYNGIKNNTAGLNSFLANFRVVSDATMYSCGSGVAKCGGFQEQITVVPEPRHIAVMLVAILLAGGFLFRRHRPAQNLNA